MYNIISWENSLYINNNIGYLNVKMKRTRQRVNCSDLFVNEVVGKRSFMKLRRTIVEVATFTYRNRTILKVTGDVVTLGNYTALFKMLAFLQRICRWRVFVS